MAVGWKKKSDQTQQRRESMTSMELAREERREREKKQRSREFAIEQTNRKASELFKQVSRVLVCERPAVTSDNPDGLISDERQSEYQRELRQWEFVCKAVIRLAVEDMRVSCHARKYAWNSDWLTSGKLQMGRVLQPTDKPGKGETRVGAKDLRFVPMNGKNTK